MVKPPLHRRVCDVLAELSGEHPILAGCAVAMPVTTNKEANIANPAPTIAFMATPLDPDFEDADLGSSSAAILPVCGVESNKK
jgi:hypothetical protein